MHKDERSTPNPHAPTPEHPTPTADDVEKAQRKQPEKQTTTQQLTV
jgi:hypothetical protein